VRTSSCPGAHPDRQGSGLDPRRDAGGGRRSPPAPRSGIMTAGTAPKQPDPRPAPPAGSSPAIRSPRRWGAADPGGVHERGQPQQLRRSSRSQVARSRDVSSRGSPLPLSSALVSGFVRFRRPGSVPPVTRPVPGEARRCEQPAMVAGKDRNHTRTPPGDLHDHAAGAAQQRPPAAHRAQISAGSARRRRPGRPARPYRIRRSAVGCASAQGEEGRRSARAAYGALARSRGQRHVSRVQLRHHLAGDEPLVGAQASGAPPRTGPARAAGEPLDHRRVQHRLRRQFQAHRGRVVGQLSRRPTAGSFARSCPSGCTAATTSRANARRLRRHRRRPATAGDRPPIPASIQDLYCKEMREAPDPGCENDNVPPTPGPAGPAPPASPAQITELAQARLHPARHPHRGG